MVILAVLLCSSCVTNIPKDECGADVTIYDIASQITGCPAEILRGIHFAESSYGENLDHPGEFDRGPFGLNERFREERTKKWGEYNPDCPLQSAIIAGRIITENRLRLGSDKLAVCAYLQGVHGVRRDGPRLWYYERVVNAPERI